MRACRFLWAVLPAVLAGACQPQTDGDAPGRAFPDGSAGAETTTVTTRLSVDADAAPEIARCLADPSGTVARFTDDEPYATVDPRHPDRILAIWQTRSGSGSVIQFVRSADGGRTWSPPRAVPINACAGGPVDARFSSDPWATFGPDGRVYLSAIAWTPGVGDGPDAASALVVASSPDGGVTWEPPVAAAVSPATTIAHDNLAITADPTTPRTVYAATTRAEEPGGGTYYGRLGFTRSDDGGRTWTPIRPITPAVNDERIGAPQIVVDPRSGRLYAVYHRTRAGRRVIGVMISEDRGESWSAEFMAAPHVRGTRTFHPTTQERFVLALDIIQAVVSPSTGELVIAFADARLDSARKAISVVWSRDGRSWSQPADVSRAPRHTAWLPALAAAGDGTFALTWFEADFGRTDAAPQARTMLRRFRIRSGRLELQNSVELRRARLEWPGDYQGLIAAGDAFLAVYGQETDIFATRMVSR